MSNKVSVSYLKDGRKMFHLDVPGDISVEDLREYMEKAEADYMATLTSSCPPVERSHPIDVDKIYTFTMTGYALQDMMAIFNGSTGKGTKYGKARVHGDRVIISATHFTDEGEVVPMPHAMVLPFKVSDSE